MSNQSNPDVFAGLEQEFQRLIFPDSNKPTAGIQKSEGNSYPNVDDYLLSDHFTGVKTYAFDLAYESEQGPVTKLGILDIDEGLESLSKALEVRDYVQSMGLNAHVAFSGGKGFHVCIFSQPVPVKFMQAVLEHIQSNVPFKGEIIPAKGTRRVKVAPCFHQVAGRGSYFLEGAGPLKPMSSRQELMDVLPDQLALLQAIRPNPSAQIIAQAHYLLDGNGNADPAALIPDLRKLEGELPPCMLKFRDIGGAASIGTYDQNSLTLRTYCNSAGLPEDKADGLAALLADRTNPDIETSKDLPAKQRHWASTKDVPSAQGPFSCALMLRAKRELRFDCLACRVAPEGVNSNIKHNKPVHEELHPSMMLPLHMSRRLLAYMLQSGANLPDAVDSIFMDKTDRAIVRAFMQGHKDAVDVFRYWDSQPQKERNLYFSS